MMANISTTPPGALGKAPEDDPWHLADRHGTQELDAFEGTVDVGWLDGWMWLLHCRVSLEMFVTMCNPASLHHISS